MIADLKIGHAVRVPRPTGSLRLVVFLLLASQLLPSVPQYLVLASSQAAGETLVCVLTLIVCGIIDLLERRRVFCSNCLVSPGAAALAIAAVIVVALHVVVADQFLSIDLQRFLASLVPLVLTAIAAMTFARVLVAAPALAVDNAVRMSFWVLATVATVRAVGFDPSGGAWTKGMFPFTETSHFALAFAPVLMYMCITSSDARKSYWLVFGFAVAAIQQSLTLVVGCLLIAIVARRFVVLALPVLVAVALLLPFELKYFAARLTFSDTQTNQSNLVYVQGWQQLRASVTATSGWGVGFQQFGVHDLGVAATDVLRLLSGSFDPKLQDVSFVLPKMVGEFGVFGVLLALFFLVAATRSVRGLRTNRADALTTFTRCVVLAYAVDIFVRGPGYFAQSTYLFVAAICAQYLKHRMSRNLRVAPAKSPAQSGVDKLIWQ